MSAIHVGTLRGPSVGDTLPLASKFRLCVEASDDFKVPLDVTVTGPAGRSTWLRCEPPERQSP